MKRVSLKKRLIFGFFVICSVITLGISVYQISRLQQREYDLIHHEISSFEQSALPSIREAVWNYDWAMVETIATSQVNPLLSYIEICDVEMSQCTHSGTVGQKPFREYRHAIQYQTSSLGNQLQIGTTYLQLHYQPFGQLFNRYILSEFLINGFGVFGVAICIFLLFHLGVLRRLILIANYTGNIDLTEVETLPPLALDKRGPTLDEVDLLAAAIDGLIERMKEEFSRRKQLEHQLNHAQKMEALGTLAGGIAHDFNNILTAMLGYVQLCHNSAEEGSKTQRRLEQVLMAGDRAIALIAQIMVFSRKSESYTKKLCLAEIVAETLELAQASWPATIEVESVLDDQLWILGDAGQLHQVLMNLATNSGYALATIGGKIKVSLTERILTASAVESLDIDAGTYVCLTFCDNGSGIPADIRDRIFDPFFTTKETGQGTGMGLAVVHGIVQAHDGEIVLDPDSDQGCCFTLYFPRVEADCKDQEEPPYSIGTALSGDEHLLLVDDDPVVIGMGKDMLCSLGYRVTICGQPTEALNLLIERNDIDLLITDLSMPEMTGVELATALRQRKNDIPIVLCTGNVDLLDPSRLADGTIDQLLQKPFTIEDLSIVIRQALESSPQNKQ